MERTTSPPASGDFGLIRTGCRMSPNDAQISPSTRPAYVPAVGPKLRRLLYVIFALVAVLIANSGYLVGVTLLEQITGATYQNFFYLTMFLGILLSALLMAVLPFWWNTAAFIGGLAASYVISGNLANTLGDSIGYRWGQSAAQRKWQQLAQKREP